MIILYYQVMLAISFLLVLGLVYQWRGRMDITYPLLFALIPVINLGYLTLAEAGELGTAILANKITYIGGCFFQLLYLLSVYSLCKIKLPSKILLALFSLSTALYICVLSIGKSDIFYRKVEMVRENGITTLVKEYGPVHIMFYLVVIGYLIANLGGLIYSIRKRPDASLKHLYLLVGTDILCIVAFFGGRSITRKVELMPIVYVFVEITFLLMGYHLRMYSISGGVMDNVLEQGADGLICFDLKKRLLVSNQTVKRMFPILAKAKADCSLDTSVPVFRKWIEGMDAFEENREKSAFSFTEEGRIYDVWVEYLKDRKRKLGYYLLILDVTTERNYIESINRYNEQMKEAAEAAIHADKVKSDFLAHMSHEIRTPINAVLGMNEMILHASKDDTIMEYAANIEQAGKTLLFLINDVLDFSKMEDGRLELVETEYSTLEYIQTLKLSIKERAKAKGLIFVLDVDETLPARLFGDDVHLAQIVVNLLTNAVKYTEQGVIKLIIRTVERTEEKIKIYTEVRDTGIGIREEDQEKLFVPFERFDEKRNRGIEGTGLGMAIVGRLLAMMDSKLELESVYGVGSAFSFEITQGIIDHTAIGKVDEKKHQEPKKKQYVHLPGAKVLVVDDNEMNRQVASGLLNICGITPDEAGSGEEALEKMREKKYHIVFLDHMMPEMDGIETLEHMKEEQLVGETVMIALTANAIAGARELYLESGFTDYLPKPILIDELNEILIKYLHQNNEAESF